MPSVRWRKIVRDLWMHRARTLMVVLAILVGLVGAGAVLDTWALLRLVTKDEYLATNPPSATLRLAVGDSVDVALLSTVRALPTVRDAQARRIVQAAVQGGNGWLTGMLFASSDPKAQRIGRLERVDGTWPPADNAFVIEHSSVDYAGASMGDSATMRYGDRDPVRLPVAGIARDKGLPPGWMDHVVYGFVTEATLATLGAPTGFDQLQFVARDNAMDREANRAVAAQVRDVAVRLGHTVRSVDVPVPGRHEHAAQMNSLIMTQGAFGLLALLIAGFLVVNLITAMLAGQLREIGVMKAVGARPAQLAQMYLAFALALGVIATCIAVPIAAWIGWNYAGFAADLLNFTLDGYSIPAYVFVLQVAAGILLPVLAAAVPVIRGSRISVAAALRDVGIDGGGATPAWLEKVRGPSRPFLLSLRNAFRRRQRMALTLVTLALGGAVFVGALDLRVAIRDSVGNLYGNLLRFDMMARLDSPEDADSIAAVVTRVPGVESVEVWSGAQASVVDDDGLGGTFPVTGLRPDSRMVALPVTSGRWLRADDDSAIVINTRVVDAQPRLHVGGYVRLVVGGRTARWMVAGVVDGGPMAMAYVTRSALARHTGDARASVVVFRSTDRTVGAQGELIERVRGALGDAGLPVSQSLLMAATRRVIEDHLLMVSSFLLVMAQLTLVIGGLGLASTMSLAVLERTREIGVLRAIGAAPGAIMKMVQLEGLVIALLSWAIALPLSLPISMWLGAAFGRIMFPVYVSPVPQWTAVAEWLAVVVVVSLGACAWPASRATRIPTVVALAYE